MNISFVNFLIRNESKALVKDLLLIVGLFVLLIPLYYWQSGLYFTVIGIFGAIYPAATGEYPGHLVPNDFSWKYYHMVVPDRIGFILASCITTVVKGMLIAGIVLCIAYFKIDDFSDVWQLLFGYFSAIIFIRLVIFNVNLGKMRKIYVHYPSGGGLLAEASPYLMQFHKLLQMLSLMMASVYFCSYLFKILPDHALYILFALLWAVIIVMFKAILSLWKDESAGVWRHKKMIPLTLLGVFFSVFFSYKLEYWQFPGHLSDRDLVQKGDIELLKMREIKPLSGECQELTRDDLLGYAISRDDIEITKYLVELSKKTNPECNVLDLGLRASVSYNSIQIMEYLLQAGANPNGKNKKGDTPLFIAADWERVIPMLILEKSGADPTVKNAKGKTYLEYLEEKRPKVYRELMFVKNYH